MPPRRIVILGGGESAGGTTANLMIRAWPDAAITPVEAPDIGTIGVGEGFTPSPARLVEVIGVAERDWMPRGQATWKVGIRFDGWNPAAPWRDYSPPLHDVGGYAAFRTSATYRGIACWRAMVRFRRSARRHAATSTSMRNAGWRHS